MQKQVFCEAIHGLRISEFKDPNGKPLIDDAGFQYLEQALCPEEEQVTFSVPVVGGEAIIAIFNELRRAEEKWPNWPAAGFEALAIVTEELGELAQAMLQYKHEGGDPERIRQEAIQVAAMGIRFALNLPKTESHE